MQRYAGRVTKRMIRKLRCSQPRDHIRPRERAPGTGTYRDDVATSDDVNKVRFARFVARVLTQARERGMTDDDIAAATGVGSSTFHRWQRGQFARAPGIDRIRAFCAGLGVPPRAALLALGLQEGRDDPEPEPAIDPDVRRILRALADPSVSDEDKAVIRRMLQMAAQSVRSPGTRSRQ